MERITFLAALFFLGAEAPEWVSAETGVISLDGKRYVFAVGSGGDRDRAALDARRRLSRILLDSAAPAPVENRGRDSLFDSMTRQEVKRSIDEVTLDGVEVRAHWESDAKTFALAIALVESMRKALDRVPMAVEDRRRANGKLDSSLGDLEEATDLPPRVLLPEMSPEQGAPDDTDEPEWIHIGCGRFMDGGREVPPAPVTSRAEALVEASQWLPRDLR
ncbi:MAG: hypothetical protein AAFX94_25370, partial [Myxococcota bacterium]